MLQKTHDYLLADLEQGSRIGTILVVVAVLFNLIALCSNSAVAAILPGLTNPGGEATPIGVDLYLGIIAVLTVGINVIALVGLLMGRNLRRKLQAGLLAMYADNKVDQYYNKTLLTTHSNRYLTFAAVMILFAIAAIALPLVLRSLPTW